MSSAIFRNINYKIGKSANSSEVFKFFKMTGLFDCGKIFYKLNEAIDKLKNSKQKENNENNIYAFEFNAEGKRGFFIAKKNMILHMMQHQASSPTKMCLYEVKFRLSNYKLLKTDDLIIVNIFTDNQ